MRTRFVNATTLRLRGRKRLLQPKALFSREQPLPGRVSREEGKCDIGITLPTNNYCFKFSEQFDKATLSSN